jgi:predicted NUDIX family NTP pyrophosphohydrolase
MPTISPIVPQRNPIVPAARNKTSAGIVLYRRQPGLEVFLVHPGGPYWARKDDGAWSIPKGEYHPDEQPLQAAQREFLEETGVAVSGPFLALAPVRQPSGKIISAWACEGDLDPAQLRSNTFSIEWPPDSGVMQSFPEVDRGAWFSLQQARVKLSPGQLPLLQALTALAVPPAPVRPA